MSRISIRLSAAAIAKSRKPDDIRKAALDAYAAAGGGEVFFAPFTSNGQRFALSSRIIVDVEWLPNRVPDRVLREGQGAKMKQKS